jgi:AraC-like DNA-binding protein
VLPGSDAHAAPATIDTKPITIVVFICRYLPVRYIRAAHPRCIDRAHRRIDRGGQLGMDGVLTYTTGFCRMLTDYLVAHGHGLGPVLDAMGVTADHLADVDGRIPRRAFLDAFEIAVALTGDADLGLHVGESVRPVHFGVLGYLMMSCETMRQAAERHRRWHELIADGERVEYRRDGDHSVQSHYFPDSDPSPPPPAIACAAASTVTFVRWLTGPDDGLRRVELPYPEPATASSRAEHARLFGCELVFDAPRIVYRRDAATGRKPLVQGDQGLRRQMEERAERLAAARGAVDALIRDVRALVARRLPEGLPDLEAAAALLQLSPRILARRLAEHGTSYTRIVDEARHQLALGYIQDPSLSLLDIAYLLGFSEQSVFQRAFKRWTDLTPGEYRRRRSQ